MELPTRIERLLESDVRRATAVVPVEGDDIDEYLRLIETSK
jgi:hypothetical protein